MPPQPARPTQLSADWWNKLVVSLELADLADPATRDRLDSAAAMANSEGLRSAATWRYADALPMLTAAVEIWARLGHDAGEAVACSARGGVYRRLGDADAADADYRGALTLAQASGLPSPAIHAWLGLAGVALLRDQPDAAAECVAQAQELSAAAGERWGEAQAQHVRGLIAEARKDWPGAEQAYTAAAEIWASLQAAAEQVEARAGVARARMAQGYLADAYQHAERILAYLGEHSAARLDEPLRVYWTLYAVLRLAQEEEGAQDLLRMASRLLVQQAEGLTPSQREIFRQRVPINRAIMAAWADLSDGA